MFESLLFFLLCNCRLWFGISVKAIESERLVPFESVSILQLDRICILLFVPIVSIVWRPVQIVCSEMTLSVHLGVVLVTSAVHLEEEQQQAMEDEDRSGIEPWSHGCSLWSDKLLIR